MQSRAGVPSAIRKRRESANPAPAFHFAMRLVNSDSSAEVDTIANEYMAQGSVQFRGRGVLTRGTDRRGDNRRKGRPRIRSGRNRCPQPETFALAHV